MITPILGATASGKTELARRLIRREALTYHAIFVDDPNSQWRGALLKRAGLVDAQGGAVEPSALRTVGDAYRIAHKRIVRFPQLLPDDLPELARLAMAYHPTADREAHAPDVALVLDELRRASHSNGWVGGRRSPLVELLFRHRHFGCHLVTTVQSPRIVDRNILSNASEVWLCRLQGRHDLEWVDDFCGDGYAPAVERLPLSWPLACVRWRPLEPPETIPIEAL